jgi:hypothetical protein
VPPPLESEKKEGSWPSGVVGLLCTSPKSPKSIFMSMSMENGSGSGSGGSGQGDWTVNRMSEPGM